ncbi:MAG: transglycosylase SLT domain-containing protein [Spirochaetales bacterium]|nr:transglycosylase SLT domain-containing protein [Spirochaetales bacterium]
MYSSFSRQLSISAAVLVLFLLPLLHAGSSFDNEVSAFSAGITDEVTIGKDFPISTAAADMNLYSPEDFLKRVVVSDNQDLGLALYDDPAFRERILLYYQGITGSREVADAVLRNSFKNRIPFTLAFSLMWAESRFDPRAINRNSVTIDRGLFQLNSASFPEMSTTEFYDIETNAATGLAYLRYCLDMGETDIIALAMYNAGQYRVNSQGAPLMTLEHISNILNFRKQLERDFDRFISQEGKIRTDKASGKNLIPAAVSNSKPRKIGL